MSQLFSSQGQRLRRELNSHKARLKPRAPFRVAAAWRVKAPAPVRFAAEAQGRHWQLNQSVEPPPPDHLFFGVHLCGGGMRFAQSRPANRSSVTSGYKHPSPRLSVSTVTTRTSAGRPRQHRRR
jgi:hypothetical protein